MSEKLSKGETVKASTMGLMGGIFFAVILGFLGGIFLGQMGLIIGLIFGFLFGVAGGFYAVQKE